MTGTPTYAGAVVSPEDALLVAYPGRFTRVTATSWVQTRRDLLCARIGPDTDRPLAVSSGCAASGAHLHGAVVSRDAASALRRLDAGVGTACEWCGATLVFERLDGVPAAVRCTGCAPRSGADTRWCR